VTRLFEDIGLGGHTRAHPFFERTKGVLGQTMIVLDEVDTRSREDSKQAGQGVRRLAHGLDGRARQGATVNPGDLS
jgi:hypothetical protein